MKSVSDLTLRARPYVLTVVLAAVSTIALTISCAIPAFAAAAKHHHLRHHLRPLISVPADSIANYTKFLFDNNDVPPTKANPKRQQGKRTDAALVILHGKTVYEKYARGFNEDRKHILWSGSKTVMALLYGVAVKEHRVKLDESICDFVKAPKSELCDIRVRNLLEWTSGLDWDEQYENGDILASSVINMLYGTGHKDMAAYVLSKPLEANVKPGESWRYSSGDSLLAAKVLQGVFHVKDLRPIYEQSLFKPLGVTTAVWESDDAGTIGGAFYFYCSARDLAKIGELFLDDGRVNGQQLVAPEFIHFMETVPPAFTMRRPAEPNIHHVSGAQLWLNEAAADVATPWPYAPADTVALMGHWGQYMMIVPSLNLIAVRLGDNRNESALTIENFIHQTINLVSGKPVDPSPATPKGPPAKKTSQHHSVTWYLKAAPLALGYAAKAACSCLYVTGNTKANCLDYAYVPQLPIATIVINRAKKETTAKVNWLSLFFKRKAKFVSPEDGCVLE